MKNKTQLFGILNCTPDSCYDGGLYVNEEAAIKHALKMEEEGADYIDIGGESTRPNAAPVSEEEELKRVIPLIRILKTQLKIPISVDTYKPKVAKAAIEEGASFINDITGLCHPDMVKLVKETGVPACIMHMQGNPGTMQVNPHYPQGVVDELLTWFKLKIDLLIDAGLHSSQIILDPGFGFGKTVQDNLEILKNLPKFKALGFPLFLGLSRKSFMMHYVKQPRDELLAASLAAASFALLQRVDYLRVHDVRSHRDAITLLDGILS